MSPSGSEPGLGSKKGSGSNNIGLLDGLGLGGGFWDGLGLEGGIRLWARRWALRRTWVRTWALRRTWARVGLWDGLGRRDGLCLALFKIAGKTKLPIKLTQPYAKPPQGQRAVSAANC